MRAPILSWPQASCLPILVCAAVVFNSHAALGAGEGPASVSFVNRDALVANGWSGSNANPLRAPSDANQSQYSGNALRSSGMPSDDGMASDGTARPDEEVMPASYSARDPNGLQLRPYMPPTGIFGGSSPEQRPANNNPQRQMAKAASRPAATQPTQAPPATQAGAERAKGLMPQFLSLTPKPKSKAAQPGYGATNYGASAYGSPANSQAGLAAALTPTARSGSAAQPSPYGTVSRPSSQLTGKNGYANASAAESYVPAGVMAGGASAPRRATQPSASPSPSAAYASAAAAAGSAANANANGRVAQRQPAVAASYRPNPAPAAQSETNNSPAAQLLVQAHAIADRATTEEDFSQVCAACQRVMANQPSVAEAGFAKQLTAWSLNRRGQLKASTGRSEEALDDFSSAIELDPHLWRAIHNRGVLMAQAGQFDKAFDDFNRTTELNPQFAKAFSNRASLYSVAGQPEPALHDYERACELDPTLEVAQRGCGRTCHMMGRLDEANQHLNKALELAPNDAAALTSRGDLYTDVGNYAEAAADYERAIALDGKSTDACRGSAWLLATCPDGSVRNPEVALHRAQLAAKMERKPDPTTYDTLAAAQASAGDFAAATQTIRRAIELAPPSERSVYQDRLSMYRQSTPFQISPLPGVRQAEYQQQ